MKTLLLISCAIFSTSAFSCRTDYDCGYGNRCIKPEGSYSLYGSCVTPTDKYGNKDYNSNNSWGKGSQPREVDSCSFNSDCGFGYRCMKESGQLYGLCIK